MPMVFLKVSAKDKATGKEQAIRICRRGLSKEEIEKMKAEWLKPMPKQIKGTEKDNQPGWTTAIFQTENQLKELRRQAPVDKKLP